jgi:hypothetical protein
LAISGPCGIDRGVFAMLTLGEKGKQNVFEAAMDYPL